MAISCNDDFILSSIRCIVPILIPLLPTISIITYYYVFETGQRADETLVIRPAIPLQCSVMGGDRSSSPPPSC